MGLNIGRMRINGTQISFWDLGGQRGLRSLWEKYFTEAHGLLYIVDSADRSRLDESRDVLRGLLHNPDLAGIPVLVFANKQDSPGAMTPHEIQTHFGLHQQQIDDIGTSQKQNVLGVTALTGDGVEEGIRWLVDAVRTSPRALALSGGEDGRLALDARSEQLGPPKGSELQFDSEPSPAACGAASSAPQSESPIPDAARRRYGRRTMPVAALRYAQRGQCAHCTAPA